MPASGLIELWRGGLLESSHAGHAVVCDDSGQIVEAWGDPDAVIFPRSSCKMIQALPLVESGAADASALTDAHLALACASHAGARVHTDAVSAWLDAIGRTEADLRCGAHMPYDSGARNALICTETAPCQIHNTCSGKHTGFLTYARHVGAGPEYLDLNHPLQIEVRDAVEALTDVHSPGHGIDGCSAPNFATTTHGLARAMARYAAADAKGDTRNRAMARLTRAMASHPELVNGEGRACTDLMRACGKGAAIKFGAEGVYIAILPDQRRGVALKIADGSGPASEAAIAALLVRIGALSPDHPVTAKYLTAPHLNARGLPAAEWRPAAGFGTGAV